jgi:hypothetical protein
VQEEESVPMRKFYNLSSTSILTVNADKMRREASLVHALRELQDGMCIYRSRKEKKSPQRVSQ